MNQIQQHEWTARYDGFSIGIAAHCIHCDIQRSVYGRAGIFVYEERAASTVMLIEPACIIRPINAPQRQADE